MNRCVWLIATTFTVLMTGLVVTQTGFPSTNRSSHRSPRRIELRNHVHVADPWSTSAATRYRQGTPTHWRDCLLQQ